MTDQPQVAEVLAAAAFPSDAGSLHGLIKALHGLGNQVRLRQLEALRTLHDGNHYFELGYSSYHQYCDRELGLGRSTSLEYVRVARALDDLPRMRVLLGQGELSWEQVRAVSRVATSDTEVEWIEFAFEETAKRLRAEVREARRTGRDAPRERKHGLPNLVVRLIVELTLEEKERIGAAFEAVSADGGADLGGGPFEAEGGERDDSARPRHALVRWADGILSGAIPARPMASEGDSSRSNRRRAPAQTILYRTCPSCRDTTLDTAEGPVSVSPERADELAPVAELVEISPEEELEPVTLPEGEIDEPNSPRFVRQVHSREGLCCANPGCGRKRNLHAHHIVFRAHGGRTVLSNEVAVCDTCHSMLHSGLLEVSGSPDTGLTWRPRPSASGVKVRDAAQLSERLRQLDQQLESVAPQPCLQVAKPAPAGTPSTHIDVRAGKVRESHPRCVSAVPMPSTYVDMDDWVGDLAEGLVRMGGTRRDSLRRIRTAIGKLVAARSAEPDTSCPNEPLDESEILRQAIRG